MGTDLRVLVSEASEILERFAALAGELGEAPLAAVARRQLRRLNRVKFTVAVVAEAGNGAGPLLNALLGREVFPERRPRDGVPVRVVDAGEPAVLIRFLDGKESPASGPLKSLSEALHQHAGSGAAEAGVDEVVIGLPSPMGRQGVELLEFPSPESFIPYARRTEALNLPDIDAILLWLDPGRSGEPPAHELLQAMVRLAWNRVIFAADQIAAPDPNRVQSEWRGLRQALRGVFDEPRIVPVSLLHGREAGGFSRLEEEITACLREADRTTQAVIGPLLWVQQRFRTAIIPGLQLQVARLEEGRELVALHERLKALTEAAEALQRARREAAGAGGPVDRAAAEIRDKVIEKGLTRSALTQFLAREVFPVIDGSPLRRLGGDFGAILSAHAAARFQAYVAERAGALEQSWFALSVDGPLSGGGAREAVAAAGVWAREELGPPPGAELSERDLGAPAVALAARVTSGVLMQAVGVGGLVGLFAGAVVNGFSRSWWVVPLAGLAGGALGMLAAVWFREAWAKANLKSDLETAVLSLAEAARSYLAEFHGRLEAAARQALDEHFQLRAAQLDLSLAELHPLLEMRRLEQTEGLPRWTACLEEAQACAERAGALLERLHPIAVPGEKG